MNEQMYSITYTSIKDGLTYSFALFGTEEEAEMTAFNLDGEYGILQAIIHLPKGFEIISDEPSKVDW